MVILMVPSPHIILKRWNALDDIISWMFSTSFIPVVSKMVKGEPSFLTIVRYSLNKFTDFPP